MLNIRFLRGTKVENDQYIGAPGVITIDTTNHGVRIHDGVTQGGHTLSSESTIAQLIENYLSLHSNSGEHDGRYYTKGEVDSKIEAEVTYDIGNIPPSNPKEGQPWLDTNTMTLFTFFNGFWVQVVGEQGPPGKDASVEDVLVAAGYHFDTDRGGWGLDLGHLNF